MDEENIDEMGISEQADGSALVDLPEIQSEEQPDGSAIITMPDDGPEMNPDFYSNLADSIDNGTLSSLAMEYIDLLETDKQARELRDKQYEEGIRRTGMGNDAPGGATFMGASKVVHPVMAEGCVDFAARAIKELFPPDGPVKTKILGKMDDMKTSAAERKRDYLNWQITEQIEEFRDEQEQMLTQLPLGGSQYFKLWFDEEKKRPCVEFLPIDRVILPFAATNFYTAQRAAEVHEITAQQFQRRIRIGMYRDVNVVKATMEFEPSKTQKANDKIEGKKMEDNQDGLRKVYHIYTYLELEDDKYSKGAMAPYILMIDELDNEVVGLYRNWEEQDDTMTKLDWVVEFKFTLARCLCHWPAPPDRWLVCRPDRRTACIAGLGAHQQRRHHAQAQGRKDQRPEPAGGSHSDCGDRGRTRRQRHPPDRHAHAVQPTIAGAI